VLVRQHAGQQRQRERWRAVGAEGGEVVLVVGDDPEQPVRGDEAARRGELEISEVTEGERAN